MVRFYHVFLSSASAATEFITIVMKFPRDKQQRKKRWQKWDKAKGWRRSGHRQTGGKRIYFNSYFIRSFYLSNPWALEPAAWDNQHNEWSALKRVLSMDYAFVYKAKTTKRRAEPWRGMDELCQKQMLFISNAAVAWLPPGLMFLILFSSSSSSHNNNNNKYYSNNFILRHIAAWRTTDVLGVRRQLVSLSAE